MGNHYHLLVETPDANLAKGMRQLNGLYTHLFQGRCFDGSAKRTDPAVRQMRP